MNRPKRRNKKDHFTLIISYSMIINLILIVIFFFLSKSLSPIPAFYSRILFLILLDFMFISVMIVCLTAMVISHRKIGFRGVTVLSISVFLCAGCVFVSLKTSLTAMIKDIPYAFSSNYSVTEGICSDTYNVKSQFYFKVNKIYFRMDVSAMKNILNREKYRVVYLPNSKTIIKVNPIIIP